MKLTQIKRVLLKLALGPCKNIQFVRDHYILRYSARINELRINKIDIETKNLGDGVYEYTLMTPLDDIDFEKCALR